MGRVKGYNNMSAGASFEKRLLRSVNSADLGVVEDCCFHRSCLHRSLGLGGRIVQVSVIMEMEHTTIEAVSPHSVLLYCCWQHGPLSAYTHPFCSLCETNDSTPSTLPFLARPTHYTSSPCTLGYPPPKTPHKPPHKPHSTPPSPPTLPPPPSLPGTPIFTTTPSSSSALNRAHPGPAEGSLIQSTNQP